MKVMVTASTQMNNPIGDGHDYRPGEVFDIDDATGEAWIARGWVQPFLAPVSPAPLSVRNDG